MDKNFIPTSGKRLLAILFITTTFISLNTVSAKKKPDWVKQRPNNPDYYIGRAVALKQGSEITYRSEARNKALKQLSSEIKVNISSNSILSQFENNYQVKEQFESKTYESVEATLEGYEVFTWEGKKEYWVMMRLSKEKYALHKKMKLDNAKKISATYYYEGQESINKGSIYQGLLFYIQAIKAIKPHVGEDLTYRDINGNINLGSDIFSAIQDAFKKVKLQPEHNSYQIQFSKELKMPLTLEAFYYDETGDQVLLPNIPLRFYFSQGEGELTKATTTNNEGKAVCDIHRLISKRKNQQITATFNTEKFYEEEADDTKVLLQAFFHEELLPSATFNIEVQKSSAYIEINETVFGDQPSSQTFGNMMRAELAQSYFNITQNKNEADFVVKINTNFVAGDEKKGQGYSLFIVFVEFHMSITDNKTHMEIFADGFSDFKGMLPGSYEHALKDARQKAKQKIINDILPKMEQVNL
ncbi:LPP20 family lipoprotein [Plebeiibacterium marinum]|uniref:LPP20 family lipoprotein n=1 Tax=Plebeiibacterium marinum TaxID=2992111 RepID=A0AAE3SK84_9BACT|nr:LPP20 family lipoprotein [Plebeiobacterium marinum]MCW3805195.1 LPP20 family lipoprotein [Plebeiobacterium marinum]